MVHAQIRIGPETWDTQNSLGFWNANRSPRDNQITKKKTYSLVD